MRAYRYQLRRNGFLETFVAVAGSAVIAAFTVLVLTELAIAQDKGLPSGYMEPDPNFKIKRTPDGQPDIMGRWQKKVTKASPDESIDAKMGNDVRSVTQIIDPPDGKIPRLPSGSYSSMGNFIDPHAACLPNGIPRQTMAVSAVTIIQTPTDLLFLHVNNENFRHIILDGRPHIGSSVKLWMGDARGRWEKDTLIVDVTNNNDKTFGLGGLHSDQLHSIERYKLIAEDTIQLAVTVDDPQVFSRPWTQTHPIFRRRRDGKDNFEMLETYCAEGNKSVENQIDAGRRLYPGFSKLNSDLKK